MRKPIAGFNYPAHNIAKLLICESAEAYDIYTKQAVRTTIEVIKNHRMPATYTQMRH